MKKMHGLIFLFGYITSSLVVNAEEMNIQVGPRPYFLISQMKPSALKNKLESCQNINFKRNDF
jgi:glycerophosphoryl diester phosphodiesterase